MITVDLTSVAIAGASAMITGGIWYGPLFGKDWMKLVGLKKEDVKKGDMPKMYVAMFIGALVEAYMLSIFIHYAGAFTLFDGIKTGIWAWLGFVSTVMLGNYMFSKKPMRLYFIDASYALVNLMVMGAIIASMW